MTGWEPAEVTTHEYDGDRLVRSVTVRESEWSREQVVLLLAWQRAQDELGPHGFPMSEATDPANQGAFEGYVVTDYVERAKAMAKAKLRKDYPDDPGYGHLWSARRKSSG